MKKTRFDIMSLAGSMRPIITAARQLLPGPKYWQQKMKNTGITGRAGTSPVFTKQKTVK